MTEIRALETWTLIAETRQTRARARRAIDRSREIRKEVAIVLERSRELTDALFDTLRRREPHDVLRAPVIRRERRRA